MKLLKELCETPGIPGFEDRLRPIVRRELTPLVDDIQVDALGNLIGVKKKAGAPKLMIAAHMDEIGFVVSYIDEKRGLLRLVGLGGHDPRNMQAQRVTVSTPNGDLPGVLYAGVKPPHLQTGNERGKSLKLSDFAARFCRDRRMCLLQSIGQSGGDLYHDRSIEAGPKFRL